jgi:hypothetical protein
LVVTETEVPAGITIESPQFGTAPHDQLVGSPQSPEARAVHVAGYREYPMHTHRIKIKIDLGDFIGLNLFNFDRDIKLID